LGVLFKIANLIILLGDTNFHGPKVGLV